jgi:pyruvate dehydrogenase E1 component
MKEMLVEQKDVFYYVTVMNENYAQPNLPEGVAADVIRGCYKFGCWSSTLLGTQGPVSLKELNQGGKQVTLMGSGAIFTEVIKAAQLLVADGFDVDLFSVTSWSELARDGAKTTAGEQSFIAQQLAQSQGPIIAATDYVRAVPESVRAYLPKGREFVTLGTDGFGRSDTRAALRQFFGVDANAIAQAARNALAAASVA